MVYSVGVFGITHKPNYMLGQLERRIGCDQQLDGKFATCKGVLACGGRVGLGNDSPNHSYKYGKALEHLAFIRRWTFEHEHSVIKKKV